MIKEAIIKLSKKEDLTYDEAEAVMNEIMDGAATPVQMASYLTALSMKGETIDEITGSAEGMRSHALQLKHDMEKTFEISQRITKEMCQGNLRKTLTQSVLRLLAPLL